MNRKTEFLNPANKLVDEVVSWLLSDGGHVRQVEGAPSLAHIMVVVPTAQSGRNLRLALAQEVAKRGMGGLLPPRVVLPISLIRSADAALRLATETELRATFARFVAETDLSRFPHLFHPNLAADFRAQLAFFDQLADIWRILAGGGLTMADVPASPQARDVLNDALGDESARWEELAEFERDFFARLQDLGLRHPAADIKLARTNPQPLPADVEEVVLPLLADPITALYDVLARQRADLRVTVLLPCAPSEVDRFDDWGRPRIAAWTGANRPVLADLRAADIVRTATDADLAVRLAADFPPPDAEVKRPALGLCDDALFPELAASFLNRGYALHNPERHRLSVSSLGRMLVFLLDLYVARKGALPWAPFVALLREDDVLSILTDGADQPARLAVLAGVDVCRNRFLPTVVAEDWDVTAVHSRDQPALAAFRLAARALRQILRTAWGEESADAAPTLFLRRALQAIFARRALSGSEGEKEFRAATDCVRETLDAFDSPALATLNLNEDATVALVRKALATATYSLEPSVRDALHTEGWLELVWSAADKVALVGFTEGAVPDSVVGHPFVPDALRLALGLTSNAGRMARDTMLLANLVRARAAMPGSVRAYLARVNAQGDQRRPSRLLFLVPPDRLADRVAALFGDFPPGGLSSPRTPESAWRPNLPLADVPLPNAGPKNPEGRLSASAIDVWLKCPFTYLLKYGLGLERTQEKDELEANDFGLLIHGVLEDYANEQLARGAPNQLTDAGEIAAAFSRLLAARRATYGARLALKLRLQFDAAEGRLCAFATIQAAWAQDGWRIAEKPEYRFTVRPFAGEGVCDLPFTGSIDRIDYKEGVGYRLIDYKTWDRRDSASAHVLKGGREQNAFAARLHLPQVVSVTKTTGVTTYRRFISVQLLLYAHCLACADAKFRGQIADCCYAILGRDAANTCVFGSVDDAGKLNLIEHLDVALETVRTAIRRIRGNFFWPPGPDEDWKRDYRALFMISPERDLAVGTPWREAQEAKLEKLEVEE